MAVGRQSIDTEERMSEGPQSAVVHAPLLASPVSCPRLAEHVCIPTVLAASRTYIIRLVVLAPLIGRDGSFQRRVCFVRP
jgi:hypothetical protein